MVYRLVAHPRSEALVQPQRIPPCHRNQVPKPLMRHLVRYDAGHDLLRARGAILRIDQDRNLSVRYQSPILHRAGGKIWYGDMIHLAERVGDAEILVEVRQQIDRHIEGKLPLRLFAGRRPHADHRAVRRPLLGAAQVPHDERQQIG